MKRAMLFLLGLFLVGTPVVAQTDSVNLSTNTVPVTNSVDLSPGPPPAAPINGAVQTPPQQQPPQEEEIADIRPPLFFFHFWTWVMIALGALALVALLAWLWNKLKPHRLLSPKDAYELTLEKLAKARELLREENPMPYAVSVSEAIRSYLGQRFQTPSTRRTTEEFLRQMEADRATPLAEYRDPLREFLQACDLVKFGRYQPTATELEQVHQRAVNFVTATKPAPAAANGRTP